MTVDSVNYAPQQNQAASLIQRGFRKWQHRTFNRSHLHSRYMRMHQNNPCKVKKFAIHELPLKNNMRIIKKCAKEWKRFVEKKLKYADRYSTEHVNRLRACRSVFHCLDFELDEQDHSSKLFLAVEGENRVKGFCLAAQDHSLGAAWRINELITSPINLHRKFLNKPHTDGIGAALVAHTALKSHEEAMEEKGTEQGDRAMVTLTPLDDAESFYDHLGFNEFDANDETLPESKLYRYSSYLRGENLRDCVRRYGGRALVENKE